VVDRENLQVFSKDFKVLEFKMKMPEAFQTNPTIKQVVVQPMAVMIVQDDKVWFFKINSN